MSTTHLPGDGSAPGLADNDDAVADLGPLGGMLFHALRRAQGRVLEELEGAFGPEALRPLTFALLTVVARNPGLRQSQVGFALGIQRTNMVPLVDELERLGLAERRAVPGDRRARGLFATRLGAETLARLEAQAAVREAKLAERLGPGGRAQLLDLLARLG